MKPARAPASAQALQLPVRVPKFAFDLARLAPEKAAFRPALPVSSLPGVNGTHMIKLTYKEQLLHPFWQRKRLEVLELADFKCSSCGVNDKTLHVHHKHYVKGRQVWEYEVSELEALCLDCHEDAHKVKERIDRVLASLPTAMWTHACDLVLGWGSDDGYVEPSEWEFMVYESTAQAGRLAYLLTGCHTGAEVIRIFNACSKLGPGRILAALEGAVGEIDA